MRFEGYESYKDSEIEWLGNIPSEWEVKRVKDIGKVTLGKMLDNESSKSKYKKSYLKSKNIQWFKVNIKVIEKMYFTSKDLKTYRVKKNDLLLSEGGEVGKTSLWQNEIEECYIQNSVHKITLYKNEIPKYYLYQSSSLGDIGFYNSIVNLVSIKHLTKEKLTNLLWINPPLKTQTKIANHLDTQAQKIDKEIKLLEEKSLKYKELKQTLINETVLRGLDKSVKLKDSGIDWIGDIPSHWEVKRIKNVFEVGRGRVIAQTDLEKNGLYPIYSSQTKNDGCLGYINTYDYDTTLLTWTTDGANAGTVFLRKGKFNCTNICGTLKLNTQKSFLFYLWYSVQLSAKHNKRIDTNGAKIMKNEMEIIPLVIPPPKRPTKNSLIS